MADPTASPTSPEIAGSPAGRVFVFRGSELLVRDDLSLPGEEVRSHDWAVKVDWQAVGHHLGQALARAALARDAAPPPGYTFKRLREMFPVLGEDVAAVAGRGFQIAEWARTHRFCGACASPTERVAGERCMRCPACGHIAYPRISPAMMVLVKKRDAILLARHTASPTGRFSALAGFLEAGESIEDAVHREVFEEVGLRVRDLRYFGSQSWPFPHSLMVAFTAEYDGGEIRLDENEIAEAHWYGPGDALPPTPTGVSIAGELIGANLPARR